MDKILMVDYEKQIFRAICSGIVIRKNLIKFINERKVCSVPTLDRTLVKFTKKWGLLGKGKKQGEYPLSESGEEYQKKTEVKPTLAFKDSGLAKVIDKLPTAVHQGLTYFILATIVAKKLLAEKLGEDGIWGNFIVSGRPKDIKTSLGDLTCRILDLPRKTHIQRAIGKTLPQVLGEATLIDEDGVRRLRLPPYFGYEFLTWDDIDKATTRAAFDGLLVYLDSRFEFEERNTNIRKWVTTLATLNPKKEAKFDVPSYYVRRAFTVDLANLPRDRKENERIITEILHNPIPHLKIDGLVAVRDKGLTLDEKSFTRDLLYDRWITEDGKDIVDSSLLDAVILGMLILQESLDVRYYSYWAVLHYLCFLDTLGYTKGNWQEELNQEWGDYVVGSGGDEQFRKEWEEKARQVKEEKARIKKAKEKVKVVVTDKDALERATLAKYTPKLDDLKKIKTSFEEMNGDKQHLSLLYLSMDLKKFTSYLPTEKRANRVTEDILRGLEIVLTEWEEQHKPIREAYEEEKEEERKRKEKLEAILRVLIECKAYLKRWRGKDSNGVLRSEKVKPTVAKISLCLDPKTRKKYLNKTYLEEIYRDKLALEAEVTRQREAAKQKGKEAVELPQTVFDEIFKGESLETMSETIESIGQPSPTRKIKRWQYLLMKLNQKLKGKPKPPGASGGGVDEQIQRYIDSGGVGGGIDFDPTHPGG